MPERRRQPEAAKPPPLNVEYPVRLTVELPSHGPGLVSSIRAFGPSPEALEPDPVQVRVDAAVAAETVEIVKRNRAENEQRRAVEWEREQKRLADELKRHAARKP